VLWDYGAGITGLLTTTLHPAQCSLMPMRERVAGHLGDRSDPGRRPPRQPGRACWRL